MYDPARDIFTASEETQPEEQAQNGSPGNKRKRSSSPPAGESSAARSNQSTTKSQTPMTAENQSSSKRVKSINGGPLPDDASPIPTTAANLSKLPRVQKAPNARSRDTPRRPDRSPPSRRRSRSPARHSPENRRRDRRSPPRRRSPSPAPIRRSPSPPPRSPPRQRKRPGGGARISAADTEAVRRRQLEREEELNNQAQAAAAARGVHDVVRQHYNAVPQRGREWRKTDSKIKGLRSLNNWIKSAIIQKFSPEENYAPGARDVNGKDQQPRDDRGLLVLDIGCGKGGDLQKWQSTPQRVDLYVGLDPADISIEQARERYQQMQKGGRPNFRDRFPKRVFQAEFCVKDCFGDWIGDVPIVQEVGIDGSVGPSQTGMSHRWGGGGFDIVTMMFCMHYAFESEAKARGMLRNVAGALRKGGRFIGVIPNSDILTAKVVEHNAKHGTAVAENAPAEEDDDDDWDPEKTLDAPADAPAASNGKEKSAKEDNPNPLEWGNDIYRVKFPGRVPTDGIFRPPFGWKYFYFLEEAVEEIPEYVVPWEAFRALALEYDLELFYRRPFNEVWDAEKNDSILGPLSERMGVRERDGGRLLVSDEEFEAASFYHAFCFYKT